MTLLDDLLTHRGIEYITLASDLTIVDLSNGAQPFADPSHGFTIAEPGSFGLPELVGAEAELMAVLAGTQPSFHLHAIARLLPNAKSLYFDLYVLKVNEGELAGSLVVFLEDISMQMHLEQRLVQGLNEITLQVQQTAARNQG